MLKNLFVFCLTLLFATSALAAGGATTFVYPPANSVILLKSQPTTIGTAAFCMDIYEDITASKAGEACSVQGVNEWVVPQNAQVEFFTMEFIVTGDVNDICAFDLEIGATLVGQAVAVPTQAADTTFTGVYKYNLADGNVVGLALGNGTSCDSSGEYVITLWGRWVDAGAF